MGFIERYLRSVQER